MVVTDRVAGPQCVRTQGTGSVLADSVEAFCSPIDPNMSIRQIQINVPSTSAGRPYAEPLRVSDTHTSAPVSPETRRCQTALWVRIDQELFRCADCFSLWPRPLLVNRQTMCVTLQRSWMTFYGSDFPFGFSENQLPCTKMKAGERCGPSLRSFSE